MPTIRLGDISDDDERQVTAARLLAYMFWPHDPEWRIGMEATFAAELAELYGRFIKKNEGKLKRQICRSKIVREMLPIIAPDLSLWYRRDLFDRFIEPLSGLHALTSAPSLNDLEMEMTRRLFDVVSTGYILLLIASIDKNHRDETRGGASVRKAIHILCEVTDQKKVNLALKAQGYPGVNETSLNGAWRKFKSVAHLCAAYGLVEDMFGGKLSEPPVIYHDQEAFELFLADACVLQNFLTEFVPKGRTDPLVQEDKIFRIDTEVVVKALEIEKYTLFLEELTDAELSALESYAAPIPAP